MSLPCHFHDEADSHAGILVGAAEDVHDVQLLIGQLLDGQTLALVPGSLRSGLVVVLALVRGPPHGVLGDVVHDDELVLGGAAGVDAGHNVDGAQLADLALFKAFQTGLGLFGEQSLKRGVMKDLGSTDDTVFLKIDSSHDVRTSFLKISSAAHFLKLQRQQTE